MDNFISAIRDEVTHFETQVSREAKRKTTILVQMKSPVVGEFAFFKKEYSKKFHHLEADLKVNKVNKDLIESNFQNIISSFSEKLNFVNVQIDKLSKDHESVKNPLTEYVDLLSREVEQVNSQLDNNRLMMTNVVAEFKEVLKDSTDLRKSMSSPTNLDKKFKLFEKYEQENNNNYHSNAQLTSSLPLIKNNHSFIDLEKKNKMNLLKKQIRTPKHHGDGKGGIEGNGRIVLNKFEFMRDNNNNHNISYSGGIRDSQNSRISLNHNVNRSMSVINE
eukprot:CAMPEP_0116898036 /NCGR_PEP_ID=MMETSP0467-20121206/6838_1 /TAXON_ID=283647 /ORGANISM="Mesodinium pulex, Strain SPMC105" /LENGTH=275 /DNA_ID=CAMNT_0004569921 /DNA_START=88 /DNA_END=916 /DNA_ORIENTATION=-